MLHFVMLKLLFLNPVWFFFSAPQIVPMKYNPRDENSIKAVMAKANVVLNLIGICNILYICQDYKIGH